MRLKKCLTIVEYDGEEVRVRQSWIMLSDDGEILGQREDMEVIPRGGRSNEVLEEEVEKAKDRLNKKVSAAN